ncbi:small acid-soluble spore protein Tlp [Mesobacillus sp. LC4]|uniref:Small, acid-soluble spore protein Tlp n=1 Tax=Mesobacillus selenatarsenatis TaxID=388741 RepID=A0A846T6T7_9BACI|nr:MULTISPECIES: small acid-soluble spore protein Tlp [Mesobacillus]NKE04343.1 small acid-soluble spore protein Tlp [Mesobacillus selenatarsenatis]
MAQNTPKPDDRSDNVEKLQSMIHHTIENMEDAEAAMVNSSPEDQQRIKEKNERRRESIDAFRAEIKDEAHNQQ